MDEKDRTPGIGIPRSQSSSNDIDSLLRDLRDFNEDIRKEAASRLGELRDRRSVQALIGRLTNDLSPSVRCQAATALFQIGDSQATPELAQRLKADTSYEVRAKVAELLGLIGNPIYASKLVEVLYDKSPEVRKNAAISIGKLKDPSVIKPLINGLTPANFDHPIDSQYHRMALVLMGTMIIDELIRLTEVRELEFDEQSVEFIPNYFNSSHYRERVQILIQIGKPAIDVILKRLKSETSPFRKAMLIAALGKICDHRALSVLISIAQTDEDTQYRWLAVGGLENQHSIQPEAVNDVLINVLQNDKAWPVRYKAIGVIRDVKAIKSIPILCKTAVADDNIRVRRISIEVLGSLGDHLVVPTLGSILLDASDDSSRVLAAKAIGLIQSSDGLEFLLSAIGSDGNDEVRTASAISLGLIGDKRPIQYLKVVSENDPSSTVRNEAYEALKKISPKNENK